MFHSIPEAILQRMKFLEDLDGRDRLDGTPRLERLRQIPPQTGKFIALMAAAAPDGQYVEIGTSAGYSTLWLALACRHLGRSITTYEVLEDKAAIASETFHLAGVRDVVNLVHGNALDYLPDLNDIAFCFLDAEKELYQECYDLLIPAMKPGGILVADNVVSHESELRTMIDRALADDRVDALVVPIGKGELVCRKLA